MTKFMRGDLFHGLEMLRRCGAGSYGEVWLCRDLTGSLLAVKLIRKERGVAELRGVSAIRSALPRHPGVLTIHHVDEDDDFLWYTMDAADNLGADLENYLPDTLENRLKREIPVDAVAVIKQLLEGVTALHDAGIVHRDIKPDNILFLRGRAVIGDIGMAAPDISRLSLAGTLEFLPPEVRDGSASPGSIGKGGDVYALGKVLYCIVSGNPPELFPSLPTGIPRTPLVGRLNHLACRVCDRRASVRLADEADFLRELEKIERLADTPESTLERLARNRRFLVRAAAEIVLIAAGAALLAWSALRLLKPRTLPQKTGPAGPAPKEPDYPGKAATKLYRHSVYALTAQIPQEWLVFSAKALGENYAEDRQRTHNVLRAMGISEEGIALFRKIIEEKVELIFLSFREKSTDNITVRVFPVSPDARREFLSTGMDEFRLNFARQLNRIFPAAKVAVYSADRIVKPDFTMLTVEYSVNREENRQKVVYFILKDHMIDFTLSAPGERYAEYMPAFDRMIESVKFDPASFVSAPAEKDSSPKPASVPPAAEQPSPPKPASVPPAAEQPSPPKPASVPPALPKPAEKRSAPSEKAGEFKTYRFPDRVFSAEIPGDWIDSRTLRRETGDPNSQRPDGRLRHDDYEQLKRFTDRLSQFCRQHNIERRAVIRYFREYFDNRFDMIFCPNGGEKASLITLRMFPVKRGDREKILAAAESDCVAALARRLDKTDSGRTTTGKSETPETVVGKCRHTFRDGMHFFAVEGVRGGASTMFVRILTGDADILIWFDADTPGAYRRHLSAFDHMIDTLKIEKTL